MELARLLREEKGTWNSQAPFFYDIFVGVKE